MLRGIISGASFLYKIPHRSMDIADSPVGNAYFTQDSVRRREDFGYKLFNFDFAEGPDLCLRNLPGHTAIRWLLF